VVSIVLPHGNFAYLGFFPLQTSSAASHIFRLLSNTLYLHSLSVKSGWNIVCCRGNTNVFIPNIPVAFQDMILSSGYQENLHISLAATNSSHVSP